MTFDFTCDSVPALARQGKRLPCLGASHANAGTESQVITHVDTALKQEMQTSLSILSINLLYWCLSSRISLDAKAVAMLKKCD
jgi:hypothetical protein